MGLLSAGADTASEVRGGGDFSNIWVVKSHNGFAAPRGMKYTSQHCYGKAVDDKMALYHEGCFPNYTKSW